jgi:hypothetical protein
LVLIFFEYSLSPFPSLPLFMYLSQSLSHCILPQTRRKLYPVVSVWSAYYTAWFCTLTLHYLNWNMKYEREPTARARQLWWNFKTKTTYLLVVHNKIFPLQTAMQLCIEATRDGKPYSSQSYRKSRCDETYSCWLKRIPNDLYTTVWFIQYNSNETPQTGNHRIRERKKALCRIYSLRQSTFSYTSFVPTSVDGEEKLKLKFEKIWIAGHYSSSPNAATVD